MDYNQRILEVGGGKKPSKKVAEVVEQYEQALDVLRHIQDRIQNPEEDDDLTELQQNLVEWENEVEELEEKFEKALVGWKNGMARMEHANAARGQAPKPPIQPAQTYSSSKPHTQPVQSQPEIVVAEEVEEKKEGYGWLILGGLALVVTLGAVNIFQKN